MENINLNGGSFLGVSRGGAKTSEIVDSIQVINLSFLMYNSYFSFIMIWIWFVGQKDWHAFRTWWKRYPCRSKCYPWRGYYVSVILFIFHLILYFPAYMWPVKELNVCKWIIHECFWGILLSLAHCKPSRCRHTYVQKKHVLLVVHLVFLICHIEGLIFLTIAVP